MSENYVLQMEHIEKEYYGNTVLKDVNLAIRPGEVLALVGENGAGKSTLMNILFGMAQIHATGGFKGRVMIDGKDANIHSPREAMEHGIGMVHQEFMLLPGFTITENIKLNRETLRPTLFSKIFGERLSDLDMPAMRSDARVALDKIGLELPEDRLVKGLPVGYMQFVEIAREIDKKGMKLIVFDEPTAVLTEIEAERLLDTIKKISSEGVAVIFISHKLDEIMAAADTIMVLRDGESIKTMAKSDTNVLEIAELMVGRGIETDSIAAKRNLDDRDTIFEFEHLSVKMPGEEVKDFSLKIRKGEIIGLGGLAGQGKIGISNGVLGLYPTEGHIRYKGKELTLNDPLSTLKEGIAFVSEDRRGVGLVLSESIEENMSAAALRVNGRFLKKHGFFTQIDEAAQHSYAKEMIDTFQIKCTSPKQPVGSLSGGNQQKACLARAIAMNPDVLFVSEPTRGIDIGAKQLILDYLVKLNRDKHMTIVITSSELKEMRQICDRIGIVTDGRLEGILYPDSPDVEFGMMMSGAKSDGEEAQK